jgi:hypothetical protein
VLVNWGAERPTLDVNHHERIEIRGLTKSAQRTFLFLRWRASSRGEQDSTRKAWGACISIESDGAKDATEPMAVRRLRLDIPNLARSRDRPLFAHSGRLESM